MASVIGGGTSWAVDDPAGIMRLTVSLPDWVLDPTKTTSGPASRFSLMTLSGDPTTANDDNKTIAGVIDPVGGGLSDFSNITTISVDNTNPQATDTLTAELSGIQDGGAREFWPLPPTERTRDVVYRMLVPIDNTDPRQATEIIEVYAQLVLLRDTVKLDFTLTNRGTMTHNVGLRHFIDCQFGGGLQQNDGTFVILSDGTVVNTEAVFRGGVGGGVPDGWVSFDNINNPAVILRGTLTGDEVFDPGLATYSAGRPDRLEFGQRINAGLDNQFDFTPTSTFILQGEDWGSAVRWNEKPLAVGASRRYVTYFGLGGSVSDFGGPNELNVLAAYAPFELQVVEGDDPTTQETEKAYLADRSGASTWEVLAYCDNFGARSILDARATISLPPGLELDQSQGTQNRTVLLGSIALNAQASARWRVRATTSVRPGVHEIRVSGPYGRAVTRKISIPALPSLPQDYLPDEHALSMLTVPYYFQNTDAESVFASLGSLQGSDAALVRWDPEAQVYRYFPDNFVTNVEPGVGYWVLNRQKRDIEFPDPPDRQPVPTNEPFALNLGQGWNQIGCPFVSTVRFDQVTVIGADGIERSVMDACAAGMLVPTLFAYDPELNDYSFKTTLGDMVMEPYVGYWLLVLRPITLMIPAPTLMPFKAATLAPAAPEPQGGWQVPLVVSSGKLTRTHRAFGASPAAADGPDPADIMSPPDAAAANGARLGAYFLCADWGPRSGRYYTDIRGAQRTQQGWTLVVDTDLINQPVTISWPDLSQMPGNLVATLEDLQTGRTRFMRTTTSYTLNSGQGGPRQFRITVGERTTAALQIMGFNSVPVAGGIQVSYTLSAPASVDVTVRNLAGRVVKRVCAGRETAAGEASALWTGQADNGLVVPNGAYVVQVVAQSPETGERTGVLRTVYYHR